MNAQAILIQDDFSALSQFCKGTKADAWVVLVDQNTLAHCYPVVKEALPQHYLIEISAGEHHKTLDTCQQVWAEMTRLQLSRNAVIINLGGGVIGDMGGFCAATYKRGIRFITIPTTLLAQVDASVGGKLGVDFQGFKNHIGVFKVPDLVYINPLFLKTLPQREVRSGFAEVIKHALISDSDYWKKLAAKSWNNQSWEKHIRYSVELKEKITSADPIEKDLRKILNFGHTIGHAIETFYLQSPQSLLHGEAIAWGMLAEAFLSVKKVNLPKTALDEIRQYIVREYPSVNWNEADFDSMIQFCSQDKKNEGADIKAVLLKQLGEPVWDVSISPDEIREALQYLKDIKKAGDEPA